MSYITRFWVAFCVYFGIHDNPPVNRDVTPQPYWSRLPDNVIAHILLLHSRECNSSLATSRLTCSWVKRFSEETHFFLFGLRRLLQHPDMLQNGAMVCMRQCGISIDIDALIETTWITDAMIMDCEYFEITFPSFELENATNLTAYLAFATEHMAALSKTRWWSETRTRIRIRGVRKDTFDTAFKVSLGVPYYL
jgi:hypothetical protein